MFSSNIFRGFPSTKAILIYAETVAIPKKYVQKFSTNRLVTVRKLITLPKRNISFQSLRKPNIDKLKLTDNIPKQYELIYRCTMSSYLYAAQMAATFSIIIICIIAIISYDPGNKFQINLSDIDLSNILHSEYQLAFFAFGFLILNISVMKLVSKFPVRIYFNEGTKKYLGVIHGKFPKSKEILEFNVGEVKHTPKDGIIPWTENYYKLKNGKIIVLLDHYFRKPDDMNIMLGYTKL